MKSCASVFVVVVSLLASSAAAQVTYLTQARSVSANAPLAVPRPGESFFASASNFERFAQSANAVGPLSNASAAQDSTLANSGIFATFSAYGSGPSTAAAFGSSLLDVTFSIDLPTPFSLVGQYNNVVMIDFTTLAGGIIYQTDLGSTNGSPNVAGVLAPGSYRYHVRCFGAPESANPRLGTANLTLLVPSPGGVGVLALLGLAASVRRRH
jgi:hypothetical protein